MKCSTKLINVMLLLAISMLQVNCSRSRDHANGGAVQNDFPPMVVTALDGTQLKVKELTGKVVLILFQTDCDHCQREAIAIQQNISSFRAYSLYFITTTAPSDIEAFANQYQLASYPNVHFCRTSNQSILESFGPIDAPSLYIYSDRKLIKSFIGETNINEILKYL